MTEQLTIQLQYGGYIERMERDIKQMEELESVCIPRDLDYSNVPNLSTEAREKLSRINPRTLGQVSRIPGVTPSDILNLHVFLKRMGEGDESQGCL